MKELLPIGSVVLLKGGKKRIMICGRIQKKVDSEDIYDYSACYYPEGIINPRELFLFNNEDIDMIYFVGFQDAEEIKFKEYVYDKLGLTKNVDKED